MPHQGEGLPVEVVAVPDQDPIVVAAGGDRPAAGARGIAAPPPASPPRVARPFADQPPTPGTPAPESPTAPDRDEPVSRRVERHAERVVVVIILLSFGFSQTSPGPRIQDP